MSKPRFPEPFKHEHPPVQNVNEVIAAQLTFGQKASDWIALHIGSWTFIIIQSLLLIAWGVLNVTAWIRHWDPYPFILMNLVLSMQAAYTAPMIMMSQNRQAARDRLEAHNDYLINMKAEGEIRAILEHLVAQNEALADMHRHFEELRGEGGNGLALSS
jgi:uncharacterized membrane protein